MEYAVLYLAFSSIHNTPILFKKKKKTITFRNEQAGKLTISWAREMAPFVKHLLRYNEGPSPDPQHLHKVTHTL